jgi:DNA-binding transcriptional MerR regulator
MQGANDQQELPVPRENLFSMREVSRLTATKPFVIRYWEEEFPMLHPVKSKGGHRYYSREDVDTILRIRRLLYDEGFTIAGARRHMREQGAPGGNGSSAGAAPAETLSAVQRKTLLDLRDSLRAFLTLLEGE